MSVVDSIHDIPMTLKLSHSGKSVTSQPPLVKLRELVPTTLMLARFNHVPFLLHSLGSSLAGPISLLALLFLLYHSKNQFTTYIT